MNSSLRQGRKTHTYKTHTSRPYCMVPAACVQVDEVSMAIMCNLTHDTCCEIDLLGATGALEHVLRQVMSKPHLLDFLETEGAPARMVHTRSAMIFTSEIYFSWVLRVPVGNAAHSVHRGFLPQMPPLLSAMDGG